MDNLLAARSQMGISLGFHIIFACIGMAMPVLMAIAEWKYNKTGEKVYIDLAKAWSKGVAIFFAVGAVSGTLLSFELGLLWPGFMVHAGPIIGMPFSWEGTAFFLEGIFLGLFLYGWNRLGKWTHWLTGLGVGVFGVLSGIFVVAANSWMNTPAGFEWINGKAINIDPYAAMFNPAWFSQSLHMILAAFAATGFSVAGVHAFLLLKNKENIFHKKAVKIAMFLASIAAILQPISGDICAKFVAGTQPAKFAAMEALFKTEKPAPLLIGGIPDTENETVNYGIKIPYLLSFLAHGDFESEVTGLDKIPKDEQPPVAVVHYSFQVMVALGSLLAIVGVVYLFLLWKKRDWLFNKKFLKLIFICTPLGFIALEAGWIVTEVGRQPWIINGIMKTKDAVTPMPGIAYSLLITTAIYFLLSFLVTWLMMRQIRNIHSQYNITA